MAIYKHRKERLERGSEPLFGPSPSETDLFQKQFEDLILQQEDSGEQSAERLFLNELLDISSTIQEGVSAIADDSFTRCFKENHPDPWNWNAYLFPLWCMGVVLRYGVLFPLRLILLVVGWFLFAILFFPWHFLVPASKLRLRKKYERLLIEYMCSVFVASWTGVIKYHGPRPSRGQNKVWVANHTSMIDFLILEQATPFAVIMQLHGGWVGFVQTHILDCLGCIWFNRTEAKDRAAVAKKLEKHVRDPESNPLLIFPEGTCVNNEYCVMFKKGAFELGATVCPIAIKYNKIFVDAFWNSKRQSFTMHLMRLMTSWAVVCDVYYLEPQTRREGETVIEFAERVQTLICDRINIKKVPWDGYLKYYRPSPKLTEKRQQKFAEKILQRLDAPPTAMGRTNKPAIPKLPSGRSVGLPPKSPPRERPGSGGNGANKSASLSEDPLSKASLAKSGASFEVGTGPDKDAGTGTGTALDYPPSTTSNENGLKGPAA